MVSGVNARKALKDKARQRVPLRPTHPCLGPQIARAYGLFDQIVEPSFQHFALPPNTLPSTVVDAVIGAAKASGKPIETVCLSSEHKSIRQFRVSLQSRQ